MSNGQVTTTKYLVTFTMNGGMTGGRVTVEAPNKEAAAIEAPRAMVRFAKGYEAKWGVSYCHRGDQHDAYVVTNVRKARTKR